MTPVQLLFIAIEYCVIVVRKMDKSKEKMSKSDTIKLRDKHIG